MGPTLSDTALSVDPMAQQAGVPVLAISNAASGITQIGNSIFRDCLTESQLDAADHQERARATEDPQRGAAVQRHRPESRRLARLQEGAAGLGVHIATEQSFAPIRPTSRRSSTRSPPVAPDAVFVTAPAHSAAPILVQARQHGLRTCRSSAAALQLRHRAAQRGRRGRGADRRQRLERRQPEPAQPAVHAELPQRATASIPTSSRLRRTRACTSWRPRCKTPASTSERARCATRSSRSHNLPTPLGAFSFNDAHDPDYAAIVQVVRQGHFEPY